MNWYRIVRTDTGQTVGRCHTEWEAWQLWTDLSWVLNTECEIVKERC
jgi:hypothetical protein